VLVEVRKIGKKGEKRGSESDLFHFLSFPSGPPNAHEGKGKREGKGKTPWVTSSFPLFRTRGGPVPAVFEEGGEKKNRTTDPNKKGERGGKRRVDF